MKPLLENWKTFIAPYREVPTWVALFDFDGTLSPIAPRPAEAKLPDDVRTLLNDAAANPRLRVGVLSGRPLASLRRLCPVSKVVLAGNHGYEMQFPGGAPVLHYDPSELKRMQRVRAALQPQLAVFPGSELEDKGVVLAVHFRNAPEHAGALRALMEQTARGAEPPLRICPGKKVLELQPARGRDKGEALREILETIAGPKRTVYFGDDVTDADAFRAVKGQGDAVYVGPEGMPFPAEYRVEDPGEVAQALRRILEAATAT